MATYEINININQDGDNSLISTGANGTNNAGKGNNGNKGTSALGKYIATQTIQPFLQQSIGYVTSNVELMTGSKSLQQRVDFAMKGVNLGIEAYKNVQAGAAVASAIGMSAFAGGVLGLTLTAITTGIDLLFKSSQLSLQKQEEDRQRSYLKQRSGLAYSQSRRGA